VATDDPVQGIYENLRREALENSEPASWALERVRQYGVASLFPGIQEGFPFIVYAQSIPRPAWNGKRDFHRERLHQVYEFLTQDPLSCKTSDSGRPLADTGFLKKLSSMYSSLLGPTRPIREDNWNRIMPKSMREQSAECSAKRAEW
jgi:hypothetical protein